MTERLPFICYLPQKVSKLILGSFPCFNGQDYGDFFYSGSGKNHFWPILSEISGMPAGSAPEKKAICEKYQIALSDIALEIVRKNGNCSDSNLEIIKYNQKGIHRCLAAGAQKVYFTSTFVQRQFGKIFPGVNISAQLLPSPSPAANRHIGGLAAYRNLLDRGLVKNVYDYRVRIYRELLFS